MSGRLDGTEVVSRAGFLVLLPYCVLGIFLANSDLAGAGPWSLIAVAVAIQAFLFGLLALWLKALQRWPGLNARPWRVVVAFLVVSAVRAIALALALDALGLIATIDWSRRLIVSIPWITVGLVVADLAIGSVRRHRERVRVLLARQEEGRRALEAAVDAIEAQRSEIAEAIHGDLVERVARIAYENPEAALATLTATADDVVRPLSRRLAESAPAIEPPAMAHGTARFDLRYFLADVVSGRLRPGWVVLLGAAFALPVAFATLPWQDAAVLSAVGLSLVWVTMAGSNAVLVRASRRAPLGLRVALFAAFLLVAGLAMGASGLLLVDASSEITGRLLATEVLIPVTAAVALGCARAVRIQDETIELSLERASDDLEWARARSRCLGWREQRSLARAMHGRVQGAIATAAIRLEQAIHAGRADRELLESLRSQVISACSHIGGDRSRSGSLASTLEDFAETWTGVCDISWAIDPGARDALRDDPVADFAVRELAAEACWNALRHARPRLVRVEVEVVAARTLRLSVHDDGGGRHPDRAGREDRGLGSRMLDDMSLSWERTTTQAGTDLIVDVPAICASRPQTRAPSLRA